MMKKTFFTGLAILLPVAFTFVVVKFIVDFLTLPFLGFMKDFLGPFLANQGSQLLSTEQMLVNVSRVSILVALFLFTLLLGVLGRWFFLRSVIQVGEVILARIPLVNKIYKASREVFKTLFNSNNNAFKQVVLVPFPSSEGRTIGFLSGPAPKICSDEIGEESVSVFVPTTPNPTSGFLMMFKRSDIKPVSMKVDEAVRFIISCGVINEEED